jgi:methyltransferase-like protein/cyclopropane fatty-acyl-phospholipid synthase-like methyltransferase
MAALMMENESLQDVQQAATQTSAEGASYDEVPYSSYAYVQSHPNRLSVVATLFGMAPAPLERCRVLELGCASGGNLLPIAESFPEASFVGIDLSARQVADGQKMIDALGLKNIELRCHSITDVDASFGKFDYIICHGVYSWVPESVRQRIFEVCASHLNPQGVAYISYNTYPGWHMRGIVREMMLYHVRNLREPTARVAHAKALLDFLARVVPQEKNEYAMLLRTELERLQNTADNYILHEHLETVNDPVYFHHFAGSAAEKGLQFLAEAQSGARFMEHVGAGAEDIIRQLAGDVVAYEQYLDFLRNRTFRQTLLCHKEVSLDRNLDAKRVLGLYVASPAVPQGPVDIRAQVDVVFRVDDTTLTSNSPLVKTALATLGARWPEAMAFSDLMENIFAQWREHNIHPDAVEPLIESLAVNLIQGFIRNVVQLYASPPKARSTIEAKPRTSPLARLQAETDVRVTSLQHVSVALGALERAVVGLADGQKNREELLEGLLQRIREGKLTFKGSAEAGASVESIRSSVSDALDKCLFDLAQLGLLCA